MILPSLAPEDVRAPTLPEEFCQFPAPESVAAGGEGGNYTSYLAPTRSEQRQPQQLHETETSQVKKQLTQLQLLMIGFAREYDRVSKTLLTPRYSARSRAMFYSLEDWSAKLFVIETQVLGDAERQAKKKDGGPT